MSSSVACVCCCSSSSSSGVRRGLSVSCGGGGGGGDLHRHRSRGLWIASDVGHAAAAAVDRHHHCAAAPRQLEMARLTVSVRHMLEPARCRAAHRASARRSVRPGCCARLSPMTRDCCSWPSASCSNPSCQRWPCTLRPPLCLRQWECARGPPQSTLPIELASAYIRGTFWSPQPSSERRRTSPSGAKVGFHTQFCLCLCLYALRLTRSGAFATRFEKMR